MSLNYKMNDLYTLTRIVELEIYYIHITKTYFVIEFAGTK